MTIIEIPKTSAFNSIAWIILFPMQDVHPSDCLGIVDLAEIDLGGLQILVPQDNFRYDFQRHTVSAGISGRIEVVRVLRTAHSGL
jgi:hypothetical protein